MNRTIKYGLAAAVILIAALLGYRYLVTPDVGTRQPTGSADAPHSVAATPPAVAASLPLLTLPGARGGPPGEYGWGGAEGSSGGMHRVVGDAEATAMLFAIGPHCLESTVDQYRVAVRVAGLEGVSVEPYVPAVTFNNVGDEITRAYALDVDGRTLCVFVTWHPTTSDGDRDAAFEILDSLRAEPNGRDGIRITFTLHHEWDTG